MTEENRTLESVCEVATYTPANWVCLSSRPAFPQELSIFGIAFHMKLAHCSHCSRASFPGFSPAWPCVLPVILSRTAHTPQSPRQVASGALLGFSRAWYGSASCCLVLADGKASLARSASLDAHPLALTTLLSLALFRTCESGSFFFASFSHLSLNLSADLISHSPQKEERDGHCACSRSQLDTERSGDTHMDTGYLMPRSRN